MVRQMLKGSIVLFFLAYPYEQTTHRTISPVFTCVTFLYTVYSDATMLGLASLTLVVLNLQLAAAS